MALSVRSIKEELSGTGLSAGCLAHCYFSELQYFQHPFDPRMKDKFATEMHLPMGSVSPVISKKTYLGLPVPAKLVPHIPYLLEASETRFVNVDLHRGKSTATEDLSEDRWLLAFNNFARPDFLVAIPLKDLGQPDPRIGISSLLTSLQDFGLISPDANAPPHSIYFDELHVWPDSLELKLNHKQPTQRREHTHAVPMYIDVPALFLRDNSVFKEEVEQDSDSPQREFARQVYEDDVPGISPTERPHFNLFYDPSGMLLYFRVRPRAFPAGPIEDLLPRPLGCVWKREAEYRGADQPKTLREAFSKWWLHDS